MDTEYILSCSFELSEVTAVESAALASPLGAYGQVRHMVDNDLLLPEHFLRNTARHALDALEPTTRAAVVLSAAPAIEGSLRAFEDLACHAVQRAAQEDLGVVRRAPGLLGLPGRNAHALDARPRLACAEGLTESFVVQVLQGQCADLARRWQDDTVLMHDALVTLATAPEAVMQVWQQSRTAAPRGLPAESLLGALQTARARREAHRVREARRGLQAARTAIKKASKLFESLGERNNLQLVVSGKEVTLSHPNSPFKFVLRPPQVSGWLVERTLQGRSHTPYDVQWLTKDDVHLARLCVYFENTPVLDQLLAMTLFVHSGDELRLLERANWFATDAWSPAASELVRSTYPELEHKLPRTRPAADAQQAHPVFDAALAAQQAHWAPYKGRVEQWVRTWMQPVRVGMQALAAPLAPVRERLHMLDELDRLALAAPTA